MNHLFKLIVHVQKYEQNRPSFQWKEEYLLNSLFSTSYQTMRKVLGASADAPRRIGLRSTDDRPTLRAGKACAGHTKIGLFW